MSKFLLTSVKSPFEDIFSRIRNKVEGSNKILTEMKEDVLTLSQMITSHSISIKQFNTEKVQFYLI